MSLGSRPPVGPRMVASRKPQSGKGGWEFCYVVWRFGRIWG